MHVVEVENPRVQIVGLVPQSHHIGARVLQACTIGRASGLSFGSTLMTQLPLRPGKNRLEYQRSALLAVALSHQVT